MSKKNITSPLREYFEAHSLAGTKNDAPVLLALSGGADSRVLLHLLKEECQKCGATLYTAHVNHKIRGNEAARDRDFCLSLSKEYGVECFLLGQTFPHSQENRATALRLRQEEFAIHFLKK